MAAEPIVLGHRYTEGSRGSRRVEDGGLMVRRLPTLTPVIPSPGDGEGPRSWRTGHPTKWAPPFAITVVTSAEAIHSRDHAQKRSGLRQERAAILRGRSHLAWVCSVRL